MIFTPRARMAGGSSRPVSFRSNRIAAVITMAVLIAGAGLRADDAADPVKNFFLLRKHYFAWRDALFGSRRYHERKLFAFLRSLLGREITTEKDYVLASPEGIFDHRMLSRFENSRWLYIHGELDDDSAKRIAASDFAAMKGWWQSGVTVAVTGKVKNFKIDRDARGDIVRLYLEKVRILDDAR